MINAENFKRIKKRIKRLVKEGKIAAKEAEATKVV
jgi:hypothetical protein